MIDSRGVDKIYLTKLNGVGRVQNKQTEATYRQLVVLLQFSYDNAEHTDEGEEQHSNALHSVLANVWH